MTLNWKKHGIIFDPTKHDLAENCKIFAKSPQVLAFQDFIRIYFTSQRITENGKWLSCPQYVDFSKDFKTILNVNTKCLISQGGLGCFDEHGIFPFHICENPKGIFAYTSGWSRRSSVSIDMAIGLAISDNGGESFVRYGMGGPIMTANLNEPCLVGDPYVRFYNGLFHMWYIYGTGWDYINKSLIPERRYKIAHATSVDGINWNRNGDLIIDDVIDNECQALPSVIHANGLYHMVFCYRKAYDFRDNPKNAYNLGYAYSDDLIKWNRVDNMVGLESTLGEWDDQMKCYPHIFGHNNKVFLLYNGNEFGKYGFGLAELIV